MTNSNKILDTTTDTDDTMLIEQGMPTNLLNLNYNPDVLTCLANLSNDEVFTPPALVNQMLDMLPADLWTNKNAKFLDPVTKSGVFLREIAKRLIAGLATEILDLQTRINHVMTQQLYGIGITELTSLLARRSLYCAKNASSPLSICTDFEKGNAQGNIRFERTQHSWANGKCFFCGASQSEYDRSDALETHAYQFIHTDKPENLFGAEMKFDVIIGNPPYQLGDGGNGASASPIYHKFIGQAKKLNPRYLSMIVPARWYAGGKGLDEFRNSMLNDKRLKEIHDFPETSDCFAGINIRGGVCYFLWDGAYTGNCNITNYKQGVKGLTVERPLLEKNANVFVRYNEAINILRKVQTKEENSFSEIVSSRKPFGLPTNFQEFSKNKTENRNVYLYRFGDNGYIGLSQVLKNQNLITKFKIFVPKASPGTDQYPHLILSKPIIGDKNSCCTETYVVVGPFDSEAVTINVQRYMCTMFFRFMVLLMKNTQDVTKKVYSFVPMQDFNEPWTDEKLYAKYGLTADEIAFIESMIRPMDLGGANDE